MHKTHVNITWTFSFLPPLSPFGTSIVTRLFPFHPYEPVLKMVGIKAVVPMKPGSAEVALAPSPSVAAGGVCVMLTCNGKARFLKLLAPREVYRRRRESETNRIGMRVKKEGMGRRERSVSNEKWGNRVNGLIG